MSRRIWRADKRSHYSYPVTTTTTIITREPVYTTTSTDQYVKYPYTSSVGGLPSSAVARAMLLETEAALKDTQQHPPAGLDNQGLRLLNDLENLTVDQRRFIEEKNGDDILQRLVFEMKLAMQQLQMEMKTTSIQFDVNKGKAIEATQYATRIFSAFQALIIELVTSSSFRENVQDLLKYLGELIEHTTGIPVSDVADSFSGVTHITNINEAKAKAKHIASRSLNAAKTVKDKAVNKELPRTLTDDEQDELLEKTSVIIYNLTSNPKTRKITDGLMDIVHLVSGTFHVSTTPGQLTSKVTRNEHLILAIKYLRIFVERFIGKVVTDKLIHYWGELRTLATDNPDVAKFIRSIRKFINRRLEDYETDSPEDIKDELEKIIHKAAALSTSGKEFNRIVTKLLDYSRRALRAVITDPQLIALQRDFRQLATDLAIDSSGRFRLNLHTLNQLKIILVAVLIDRMVIAVPPIHQTTPKMEADISNIYLILKDILPDQISFNYNEHVGVDTRDLKYTPINESGVFTIHVSNIRLALHDLHVHWRTFKFPKMTDSGLVNVDIGGRGMDLKIVLYMKLSDPNLYTVGPIVATIDRLNLSIRDSKHDGIYNTVLKLTKRTIKRKVEIAVQDKIRHMLEMVNTEIGYQYRNALNMSKRRLSKVAMPRPVSRVLQKPAQALENRQRSIVETSVAPRSVGPTVDIPDYKKVLIYRPSHPAVATGGFS